jgi:hypothetical protein
MNASDFFNNNLLNAAAIPVDVRIEAAIVSVRPRDFDDGAKLVVYTDYRGKGLVLNQTRLGALVDAWGIVFEDWVGKQIVISRGMTKYQNKDVPCIDVEPVVSERLAAPSVTQPPRPAVGGGRPVLKAVEPPSPPIDHGSGELDSDIPF